ncbi:MAG: thymidylate kinase [Calditrichaeota bacterium]|nr:thymidylate kinase [Calditrichota bacterium]MCB9369055.1 thymidylate kinase [Calditrichota bacterium]
MSEPRYFHGNGQPYLKPGDLSGKLIVIEGTDGVGRSTQIAEIRQWLEMNGYGVVTTGLSRSALLTKTIDQAKAGHTLNVYTYCLLYVADFADRLEHEIIPALRAGFVVIADRYIYTLIARAIVRGADPDWIRHVLGFALQPDAVFYLKISLENLVPRVINSERLYEHYWVEDSPEGLDYWESGMDLRLGEDFYDSFLEYQRRKMTALDAMAKDYDFTILPASRGFNQVSRLLKQGFMRVLNGEHETA